MPRLDDKQRSRAWHGGDVFSCFRPGAQRANAWHLSRTRHVRTDGRWLCVCHSLRGARRGQRVLAWIRHGEYAQRNDVPSAHVPHGLTPHGREQALVAAQAVWQFAQQQGLELAPAVDCSCLRRAWETAHLMTRELNRLGAPALAVHEFEELAERSLGSRGQPHHRRDRGDPGRRPTLRGTRTGLEARAELPLAAPWRRVPGGGGPPRSATRELPHAADWRQGAAPAVRGARRRLPSRGASTGAALLRRSTTIVDAARIAHLFRAPRE